MNPFTRYLSKPLKNRDLKRFQQEWGRAEHLIVSTFRGEGEPAQDDRTWQKLRSSLLETYPRWESDLRLYWMASKINKQQVENDPFRSLLAIETLAEFEGNWQAMQTLPAAREALNKLILQKLKEE